MKVLGLSSHYHDAAACLVVDGRVVAAAQEERFDREKGSAGLPLEALNACLQQGGLTVDGLDAVAFYEKPFLKLERVLLSHLGAWPRSLGTFLRTLPPWLRDRLTLPLTLSDRVGFDGPVHFVPHHLSHAASAFFPSPFERAAILTADGVGEWATTALGTGEGTRLSLHAQLHYPDSLGLLYTAVTTWLGFRALRGEGKVMALAETAEPTALDDLLEFVDVRPDGSFQLDRRAFPMVQGDRMYGPAFVERFGPPRAPGAPLEPHHAQVAASLQRLLEDILIKMGRHLHATSGEPRLCIAGGVGLNITATSRLLRETPFEDLFIQPAAGDAGGALGAALYLSHALSGDPRGPAMRSAALGPSYTRARCRRALTNAGLRFTEPDDLATRVAGMIARGRIVGWFSGPMEFGPRALGHRSILADPTAPGMKDALNARVKHREAFRPYGVSVLRERVADFFDCDRDAPFMLQVATAHPEVAGRIPSALHVNGTSRLQTVTAEDGDYHALLRAFDEQTGVPMVINTSFNDNDEPIVCTPEDAVRSFQRMDLDALVLEGCLVERG